MSATAPRKTKGLVLPFQRRGRSRAPHGARWAPVEGLEKYAETSEPDNYRQRMINNGLAFVVCVVLVAARRMARDGDRGNAPQSGLRAVGPAELRRGECAARRPVESMIPENVG